MPTGFIYIVQTVNRKFEQPYFQDIPTWHKDRIYFGPCKRAMRPRMRTGDFVFGISPSGTKLRRVLFGAKIEERMTFEDAYSRFEELRGPKGPIHVRPAHIPGPKFPESKYEHIPGAKHCGDWRADIRTREHDAFFTCEVATECCGRWLGAAGPAVEGGLLEFLRHCEVWGKVGYLSRTNLSATESAPIRHGKLFTGLHLETHRPEEFMALVCGGADLGDIPTISPDVVLPAPPRKPSRRC